MTNILQLKDYYFFSSDKITFILFIFALRTIEVYSIIGNLQTEKTETRVKRNWRKSCNIFLRENEHLVFN